MRVALALVLSLIGTSAWAHAGHIAEAESHSHIAFYAGLVVILMVGVFAVARRRLAAMKAEK